MKFKIANIVAGMLVVACLVWSALAQTNIRHWSLEFRVAADPRTDGSIIRKAKESKQSQVREGQRVMARWVRVIEARGREYMDEPDLVTRRDPNGEVELLVLMGEYDVTERDVSGVRRSVDRYGKLALEVVFHNHGRRPLYNLTKTNMGRYVAQILNGEVCSTPQITNTCYDVALITGDFTEQMMQKMLDACPFRLEDPLDSEAFYDRITLTQMLTILGLLAIGGFALAPAPRLEKSRCPRSWIVVGVVVGVVMGGYLLGVTKMAVRPEEQTGGSIIIQKINIGILGILLGSIIGGLVGVPGAYGLRVVYRRAVHNLLRLARKLRLPSRTRSDA
ncbi:MAG: SecDF P1 head subdomain-containing protein [Planctomycetota bacterium]|jgi:hypothetical protein